MRRLLAVPLALSLLAGGCGSGESAEVGAGDGPVDEDAAFCTSWQELAELVAGDPEPTAETFDGFFELVDAVHPVVPDELGAEWDAFVGFNRTFRDVLVTVDYDLERVDDDLVARAFGDADAADVQSTASEVAFASMEDWAASGCGDFCTRWPELRQALDELGTWLDWANEEEGQERVARIQRTLALGTELAPEAIRTDWELAVVTRTHWVSLWEAVDFDPQRIHAEGDLGETEIDDLALGIVRTADYIAPEHLSDFIVEGEGRDRWWEVVAAWQAGTELPEGYQVGDVEPELVWIFMNEPNARHWPIDNRMQDWVTQTCDLAGTPGRLLVGLSEPIVDAVGGTLVVALVRRGGSVVDLLEPSRLRGSSCRDIGSNPLRLFWQDPGGNTQYETWAVSAARGEHESPLCWHGEQQLLAGGDHTLVVAVFPGAMERHFGTSDALAAPTLCLARDVTIAGDAEILVPAPGPCDLTNWPNELAEDRWRNPAPVDPAVRGAGTLQVILPSLVHPAELDTPEAGPMTMVAVPAGTTLNEIGREQVWPLGAACVWLPPESHLNDEDRRRLDRPTAVPLGPVPVTGAPSCLDNWWLAEGPPEDLLPLAVLPPGEVTLLAGLDWHDPEAQQDHALCATVDVRIDGDTVIDLPEWGECPP